MSRCIVVGSDFGVFVLCGNFMSGATTGNLKPKSQSHLRFAP
jgi:hypothetical protein